MAGTETEEKRAAATALRQERRPFSPLGNMEHKHSKPAREATAALTDKKNEKRGLNCHVAALEASFNEQFSRSILST